MLLVISLRNKLRTAYPIKKRNSEVPLESSLLATTVLGQKWLLVLCMKSRRVPEFMKRLLVQKALCMNVSWGKTVSVSFQIRRFAV